MNFHPNDIPHILSIPIVMIRDENKLVWHHIRNCQYKVRFGYYIAKSITNRISTSSNAGPGPDSSMNLTSFWKYIQEVNVLLKLHNFLWTYTRECLPLIENIH